MPCPIRYQQHYELTPASLYATLVDRTYLDAKLASIGGDNAAVLDLASDSDSAKYTLRQGVSHRNLPGPIQRILRGDLVIERTESWRLAAPGHYEGSITARVKNAPGTIGGAQRVVAAGDGADFVVDASAKVDVPLIGGRIESAIAEQLVRLLAREGRFTEEWLSGQ